MLKAIILDFNGVILDDEEYHFESLKRVLDEEGTRITREEYYRDCLGFNDIECFLWGLKDPEMILKTGGMDAFVARKSAYYQGLLRERTRFFPGVLDFIRDASSRYPLAVASMALREEIEYALRKGGVQACFKVTVGAEDVEKTKPDPEVYIKALKDLNSLMGLDPSSLILPGECLVIEDSHPGIIAAKAAGMRCLAITNSVGPELLQDADWRLASLKGLSLHRLESMFSQAR